MTVYDEQFNLPLLRAQFLTSFHWEGNDVYSNSFHDIKEALIRVRNFRTSGCDKLPLS